MSPSLQTSFVCPALIGREAYLDTLLGLLDGVRQSGGKALLISGEAGIGKSRLLRATRDVAEACGFLVVQGHCFEHDSSLAYGPLTDALRACLGKSAPEAVRRALQSSRRELGRLLPEMAGDGDAEVDAAVVGDSAAFNAEAEKRRIFQALTQFFVRCAESAPLLLIFEDLHWCDAVSLDYLTQLARHLPEHRIVLAVSYRADEVAPPLRHMLAELDRARLATEWPLGPLDEAQVEAMLRAIFSQSDAMRGDVFGAVYTLTEGNPFFVEEMLKTLVVAGDLVYADGRWSRRASAELRIPRSVQDAVQRRTGALSAPAREMLRLASVVGQRVDFELLRELTGSDEAEVLAHLKELIAAQLIVEVSAEQLAFRHALTRRAVYGEILARERRMLHRRVATTLERLSGDSPEGDTGELGYHAFEAGLWPQAFDYARRAGDRAIALFAPAAALEHYARAFAAAEHLARPVDAALLLGRGKAYETLGEFESALADDLHALEIAHSEGDRAVEWRALNALGFLWAARDYAQAGEYFQRALEAAQDLGDERLRAQSLNRRANWLVNTGAPAESVGMHREALELFQRLDDQAGIGQTYDLLGMASGIFGDAIGAVQSADQAIPLLRQSGDTVSLSSTYTTQAAFGNPHLLETAYSALKTREECERNLAEARRLSRQTGARSEEGFAAFTECSTAFAFGDYRSGMVHGLESLRIAESSEHAQWVAATRHALTLGNGIFLFTDLARAQGEQALATAKEIGSAWWRGNVVATLSMSEIAAGRLDEAEALLRAEPGFDGEPRNLPERRMRLAWGRLLQARGDAASALAVVDALLASVPGNGHGQPIPWLLLLRGGALAALHREDEAITALEAALRGAQLRHETHAEWRVRAALATIYLATGRRADAAREGVAAQACIAALAATVEEGDPHERFTQAAMEYLPQRLRTAVAGGGQEAAAKGELGGLTTRERQVATLVARGLANRAIADELVVSERTVESHVTNILGKLGFNSRAQIATWVTQHDMQAPHHQ